MARKMTDEELRAAVERAITGSEFQNNSEIQENQQAALNSYLGRNKGPSAPGDADEHSFDVADVVESVTSQILPAFKGDELAVWEPKNRDDVQQARLESKICNQALFDMQDGELELQSAIRDGLLLRTAIIKCDTNDLVDVSHERYKGLSAVEFQAVQRPTAPLQEVKVTSASGEDLDDIDANITRTTTFRELTIVAIDPVNFIIDREWTSINPAEAPLVGERRYELRGDLVAQGFPREVVDNLPSTDSDTRIGSLARNRSQTIERWDVPDKSLNRIEIFEVYMRVDFDGDSIPERRKIIYAGQASGGTVLSNEPHPFQPYAIGVPFLYPHRWQGLSIYDKLCNLENVKTRAVTQWVNNLENSNFPELVIADGEVAEADVTSRKSSGVIRADRIDAVKSIPVQDIGLSSMGFLRYQDQVRSERTGAALDLQSGSAQIASESAYGVERLITPREMISNMIAETLGSTLVKQLFKLIHQNLREFFTGPQEWHVGGNEFVQLDTINWSARNKVRVTAGMSEHQRQQIRSVLSEHLLQQEKLFQAGFEGVLVDLDTYYETLISWSKAGGLMTPRKHWIDPRTESAQAALQKKQETAQQQQDEQQASQDKLFDTQVLIGDRDNRTSLVRHLTDLQFKYWKGTLDSEIEELRVQAQGAEDADPDPKLIDADQAEGRRRG